MALVRMKLIANRRKDQVHLLDLIGVGTHRRNLAGPFSAAAGRSVASVARRPKRLMPRLPYPSIAQFLVEFFKDRAQPPQLLLHPLHALLDPRPVVSPRRPAPRMRRQRGRSALARPGEFLGLWIDGP